MSAVHPFTPDLFICRQSVWSIEQSLSTREVSKAVRDDLFRQLDKTFEMLGNCAKSSVKDEIAGKIVNLFGRIADLSVQVELKTLENETKALEEACNTSDREDIILKSDLLRNHIINLCYECALLQTEREVIREANAALQKANTILQGVRVPKTTSLRTQEEFIDLEVIAPFFDIAYEIYKGNFRSAKKLFNQLTAHEKQLFLEQYRAMSSEEVDFASFPLVSIQALLASAYAICELEYPAGEFNSMDIQLMFHDLDQILEAE